MKVCLTVWSVDLVTVGVYGGLWREGRGAGLGSRHSFPSKEAPEEGKGSIPWCQWLCFYGGGVAVLLTKFWPCDWWEEILAPAPPLVPGIGVPCLP